MQKYEICLFLACKNSSNFMNCLKKQNVFICQISDRTSTCPHMHMHNTNTHARRFLVHFFQSSVHCEHFSIPLSLLGIKMAVMHCFRGASGEGEEPVSFRKKATFKAFPSQKQTAEKIHLKWFKNRFLLLGLCLSGAVDRQRCLTADLLHHVEGCC